MTVDIREAAIDDRLGRGEGKRLVRDFLEVASYIYRDDRAYVRPLDFDLSERLSPKNPFFEHAEGAVFVAYRNDKPVGRVTAQIDREHLRRYDDAVGFFGFLDTIDDAEVAAALIERAGAWLRDRGMKTLRGPLSLSINEEVGCLVEGFDTPPMILMPHHRPYQGGLIEKAGLTKAKDFFAWAYTPGEVPRRARKACDDIEALPEVELRKLDLGNLRRDVRIFMDIFNDAWSENWGFVPLTERELDKMATDLRLLLNPDMAFLVYVDKEPCAVCIAMPNLNQAIRDFGGKLNPVTVAKLLYRMKVQQLDTARLAILGIRKKLRHVRKYAGLSAYMYVKINDAGSRIGYRFAELSWTLEDNGPVNTGIKLMGGKVYKRYRVYEKALGA